MKVAWTSPAWDEYVHWTETDRKIVRSINALIDDARRSPFKGFGKPEPLKHDVAGWWSRITSEHRLVYRVHGKRPDQVIEIASCRFHYS